MADNVVGKFKIIVMVMLFYSLSITVISYALEAGGIAQPLTFVQGYNTTTNFNSIDDDLTEGLTRQTDIPVLDVGALVFYSGNILIDLLLNFIYAIPEMLGFLIFGFTSLFDITPYLIYVLQAFFIAANTALYVIGLIQLLSGVRSGRII